MNLDDKTGSGEIVCEDENESTLVDGLPLPSVDIDDKDGLLKGVSGDFISGFLSDDFAINEMCEDFSSAALRGIMDSEWRRLKEAKDLNLEALAAHNTPTVLKGDERIEYWRKEFKTLKTLRHLCTGVAIEELADQDDENLRDMSMYAAPRGKSEIQQIIFEWLRKRRDLLKRLKM